MWMSYRLQTVISTGVEFHAQQFASMRNTPFALMWYKSPFSVVLQIFLGPGRLRLSRGRSRKVYVLIAINTVPLPSLRFAVDSAIAESVIRGIGFDASLRHILQHGGGNYWRRDDVSVSPWNVPISTNSPMKHSESSVQLRTCVFIRCALQVMLL